MGIMLAGLVAGAVPAAAEDDPFDLLDALWRQQTEHPPMSVTVPDPAGHPRTIEYVEIDGHAVTEGDIVIGTAEEAAAGAFRFPGARRAGRVPPVPDGVPARSRDCRAPGAGTVTAQDGALWPGRTVPYEVSPTLPAAAREALEAAVRDFHGHTCVRFVPRTSEEHFLRVVPGDGCYSYVGRSAGAGQDLSIGQGCEHKGIVIHELMHAIGFYHEHSRADRDAAVTVHLENVIKGFESQFKKLDPARTRLFGPLDYGSVMLYGRKFFSSNGQDTLVPAIPVEIGQRRGFSLGDLAAVRTLYQCPPPRP
ncbi:astacin [Sphaerisporangium siamense]|uniref:Astacin n=2 Tax=Sphaerisporangium siamense TaxID=795645 RepID=A0A7W7DER7_9ACTN|nr:astacin [Sphaerisporangium siamense]